MDESELKVLSLRYFVFPYCLLPTPYCLPLPLKKPPKGLGINKKRGKLKRGS
jgi:hypothetical protein